MRRHLHLPTGRLVPAAIAMTLAALAGCAGSSPTADWRARAEFGQAEDAPRIVVYGNLAQYVPQFNPTPKLDEFLYGPSEPPGLMLRNPQGLIMRGTSLLVCDQGYPDILSIDLATGRSTGWSDPDHRPRCPVAIAAAADGSVYVADTTSRAVLVYSEAGKLIEQLSPTSDPERAFKPSALLLHGDTLYVGNVGEHRVDRYDVARREWVAPLVPPAGDRSLIAPTGLALAPNGTLLIADTVQARVFRVGPDGKWLEPIGSPGRMPGQFVRPKQVACTPSGLIFVTDAARQSVLVFDAQGQFVTELHEREPSKDWAGFTLPAGVLALPGDGLDALLVEGRPAPDPRPAEWVIVSDTLQASSLTVLGVHLPQGGGGSTHAAP